METSGIYTHTHKHTNPVINIWFIYIFLKMLYEICVYIDSLLFMKYSKKMHMKCSFRVPQQLTLSHWEFRLQGARTLVDPREIIQGILFYMVFYEGKKHCVCWQLSTMGEF